MTLTSTFRTFSRNAIRKHFIYRTMSSKKAVVFVAPGTEEMEAVIAIDVLRRAGIDVTVAGIPDGNTVKCSRGVNLKPDIGIDDLKGPFDMLVLPGGLPGSQAFIKSKKLGDLLKEQESANRAVATICAAPTALLSNGVFFGKNITSYPAVEAQLSEGSHYNYKKEKVVVDGQLITSQGPGTAFDWALAIVEKLTTREKAQEVAKAMLLTY